MIRQVAQMLAAAAVLTMADAAWPAHAQVVQQYDYRTDAIYPVCTGLGLATEIVLDPHEKVLDYSTGFSNGWYLTRRDNVFYLRPKNVDVDTNMMVRTETHWYIFELHVVASDWKRLDQARNDGVQYKITFKYPADASFAKTAKPATRDPSLDTELVPGRRYNFHYDYAALGKTAPWLMPVNVYDDGHFTYIKLSDSFRFPTGSFPTVHMREHEHGADSLVNSTVRGNTIVVHGAYPYLVLRQGDDVVGLRRGDNP
ncbi:MAG: TrbG/VirB9 family P-type conjugative transfer protein [Rhodanobacteraceae bacterium]